MSQLSRDRLYKLLPAIYQLRDAAEGEPLKALLAVIEQEVQTIEEDLGHLYDNWFIETCAEWVIPYMGDLLDVRELHASSFPVISPQNQRATIDKALLESSPSRSRPYGQQERRAYVANTLAYRRRKGTTPVLEQLVRDVTGWRARAVEFYRLLLTTQYLNHLRPLSATVNLRDQISLDLMGTPFEQQATYTAEVRQASQGGQYNIPIIGLFVWRLRSYPIEKSTARIMPFGIDHESAGRFYTFSPLGYEDVTLFNQPQAATDITKQTQEINLPAPLRYSPLANELKERRQLRLQGEPLSAPRYFNKSNPVLQIFVNGQPNPIPSEEILICRLALTTQELAEATVEYQAMAEQGQISPEDKLWRFPNADSELSQDDTVIPTKVVAVDPELGRIAFLDRILPERIDVSYLYGFSDDLGGGPYSRGITKTDLLNNVPQRQGEALQTLPWINPLFWEVEQATDVDENPLDTAIQTWNRTVSAWQALRDQVHIRLARITVPPVQVIQTKSSHRPKFKPGIVSSRGLTVLLGCCPTELLITPGLAIDRQGRRLDIQQIEIFDLNQFDLSVYPNQTGQFILVIFYRAALQGPSYQFALVPETAMDDTGYPEGTFIPLARLKISADKTNANQPFIGQLDLDIRDALQFQPGIIQGLDVQIRPGTFEVTITPGTAVDSQARVLVVSTARQLRLGGSHQGKTDSIVLLTTGQIQCISQTNADIESTIFLTHLEIPSIEITVDEKGRPEVSSTGGELIIAAGTFTDAQGQTIKLEREYRFDLSAYAGQRLVLFISSQTRQGLPLKPIDFHRGQDWQQLGIVPEEPEPADAGTIFIQNNNTYEGDLRIAIPHGKKLKIMAADGYRPHLHGNIWIQGTAPAEEPNQGEMILNGLLMEGQLTILPGNLKRLHVIHSTLVPQHGGINVQQQEVAAPCTLISGIFNPEDPFAPLAYVMTVFTYIQGLWCANVKFDSSPEKQVGQITQLLMQEMTRLLAEIWQVLFPWGTPIDSSPDFQSCEWDDWLEPDLPEQETPPLNNSRLEISLYKSICGPLTLTEAIPKLRIEDCILDKGHTRKKTDETSGLAIWASGTETEIFTTTVLGMSIVRSLEASNSLFTEKVIVQLHQQGCIRFSHVPEGSQTPPRYQCQPDLVFQEALDPIPEAITSLAFSPKIDEKFSFFAGTAGGGVFYSLNNGETWERKNQGLSNHYVAAILAYSQPGIGEIQIDVDDTTVVNSATPNDTAFIQQLRPEDTLTINQQTRIVDEVLNNGRLKVRAAYQNLTEQYPFEINTVLVGTTGGKIFRSKNNGDDWVALALPRTTSTITALHKYNWTFTGTLIGNGSQIEVDQTIPKDKFRVGDTVTIRVGDTVTTSNDKRTRRIEAVEHSAQRTTLILNAPFTSSSSSFYVNALLAATAGDGILIGNSNGEDWMPINKELTNLDIRALVVKNQDSPAPKQVFAGTAGNGIFQLVQEWTGDERSERWRPLNNGLKNSNITTLAVDPNGIIFVGTVGGGVFHFNFDENKWIAVNQGLTSLDISALVINGNSIVVATMDGKIFHLAEESVHWEPTSLDLKGLDITALAAMDPSHQNLFAGTAAGNILRSESKGDSWLSVNAGLPNVTEKLLIMEQLQPTFTSTCYGDPGYAQLSQSCVRELCTGAEDGSEMGVFSGLKQPQREANLQTNLEEYLRFGLEAEIFYAT